MALEHLKSEKTVTRTFDWRGEHTGYQVANSWVPLDQKNTDAKTIAEMIASGAFTVLDPEITSAIPTRDRNGKVTGFDTNIGFVPHDKENALYKILELNLNDGKCDLKQSGHVPLQPKITHLIFCITFDRPWPHLAGEYSRSWKYRPNDKINWREFDIKMLNLPITADDLYPHILEALRVEGPNNAVGHQLLPIRKALLQIEIPVASLRSLYKGERAAGFGWIHAFLESSFAQNIVRSGRTTKEGPEIEWLIINAPQFLSRAVVDVTNSVINSFLREYGGQSVGYLSEATLHRALLVFARRVDASVVLHSSKFQPENNFQLQGEWLVGSPTPDTDEPHRLRQYSSEDALFRIRGLIESGFPLEALSIANAFLELIALPLALALAAGNRGAEEEVEKSGYTRRTEIISVGALAQPNDYIREALQKYVGISREIYPHRNDYMHSLRSRNHDYWRTVDLERQANELLDPLLDKFHGGIWLGHLASIITGTSHLTAAAKAAAQLEAQPRTSMLHSIKRYVRKIQACWRKK